VGNTKKRNHNKEHKVKEKNIYHGDTEAQRRGKKRIPLTHWVNENSFDIFYHKG